MMGATPGGEQDSVDWLREPHHCDGREVVGGGAWRRCISALTAIVIKCVVARALIRMNSRPRGGGSNPKAHGVNGSVGEGHKRRRASAPCDQQVVSVRHQRAMGWAIDRPGLAKGAQGPKTCRRAEQRCGQGRVE